MVAKGGNSDTIVKCNVKNEVLDVLMAVFTLHLFAQCNVRMAVLRLKRIFLRYIHRIHLWM